MSMVLFVLFFPASGYPGTPKYCKTRENARATNWPCFTPPPHRVRHTRTEGMGRAGPPGRGTVCYEIFRSLIAGVLVQFSSFPVVSLNRGFWGRRIEEKDPKHQNLVNPLLLKQDTENGFSKFWAGVGVGGFQNWQWILLTFPKQQNTSEPIFGKGMRRSTFQWKKGVFSEKGEAIQWVGGLVRISTGKAIQWSASGHSLNRRTLKSEKLLSSSLARKSALNTEFTKFSSVRTPEVYWIWFSGIGPDPVSSEEWHWVLFDKEKCQKKGGKLFFL